MKSKQEAKRNVPALRFPGFGGEWEEKRIEELLLRSRLGGNYENSESPTDHPLIKMGNLGRGVIKLDKLDYIKKGEKIDENDRIQYGDLFFNTRNTLELVGKVAIWENQIKKAYYNSNLMYLKFDNNFFMNYCLNSYNGIKKLKRLATGTTSVAAIYTKDFINLSLPIPANSYEQQKIASFLSSIDERLQQLQQQQSLLEQYKKGCMQKIFSQRLRFKDDQGETYPDWKEKKLGEIATKKTEKNKNLKHRLVLTNSAIQGIVSQTEYFDKEIANRDNLSGYYIVELDDFVYNPRISAAAPVGPIKRNTYNHGIMSPLYSVFRFHSGVISYFEQFFESDYWHEHMENIANYGARHDRMNITANNFYMMSIPFPSIPEQTKIADLLSALDEQINSVKQQIAYTQQFRKGLLQQLFV